MNAKELRIGNMLYRDGIIVTIDGRSIFDIDGGVVGYEAIPLTPEWMERCGFEKDTYSQYGGWLSPVINEEKKRLRKDEFGFYYAATDSSSPMYIQSIHWLQNWHYYLTGQELPVKI